MYLKMYCESIHGNDTQQSQGSGHPWEKEGENRRDGSGLLTVSVIFHSLKKNGKFFYK